MNSKVSLALGVVMMITWIILGFVVPVGAGWVHLLLAGGILLLVRAVVMAAPRGDPKP